MKEIDLKELYRLTKKEAGELENDLHTFAGQMLGLVELRFMLKDSAIKQSQKNELIAELMPKSSKYFPALIRLLIAEELINKLPGLAKQFSALISKETGQQYLEISSARELSAETKKTLLRTYGDKQRLRFIVKPNLLGGIRLKWEDGRFFDATVSGELEALKEAILV
jgi:F0F1-type ATP synthase delta subunit